MVITVNDGKTICMNGASEVNCLRDIISDYCGHDAVCLFDKVFKENVQAAYEERDAAYEQMEEWERVADVWRLEYSSVRDELFALAESSLKTTKQKTHNKLISLVRVMNNNL